MPNSFCVFCVFYYVVSYLLGKHTDSNAVEEGPFDINDSRQKWTRSADDDSGYFTLKHSSSTTDYLVALSIGSTLTLEGSSGEIKKAVADGSVGNQICNDEFNHPGCNFDGGDFCLTDPNSNKDCVECICFPNGVITSPRFPDMYSTALDIVWLIQVPSGQLVEINFIYMFIKNIIK